MLNEIQKEILRAFLDHDGQMETVQEVYERTDARSDEIGSRQALNEALVALVRGEYVIPQRQREGPDGDLVLEGPFQVNDEEVQRLLSGDVL